MNNRLQIFLFIILIGCSNSQNEELKSNSSIISIFNKTEIRDLNLIFDFFNNQICKHNSSEIETLDDCYTQFFKSLAESYLTGTLELDIPFYEQLGLYENISDSTFNNLWTFNKCRFSDSPDTFKCIGYKYDGKIILLLKELSKENLAIKNYYETFLLAGDIAPSMIGDLAVYYEKFKIDDVRVKLLVALHYLTLNDEFKRKEKIKSAPNNGEHP